MPQAPTTDFGRFINPAADRLAAIQGGLDVGQKLARLSQLKDQLDLEDAQRKAEKAKADAMRTEADLMHGQLAQQFALRKQQADLAAAQVANQQSEAAAVAPFVGPTAEANAKVGQALAGYRLGAVTDLSTPATAPAGGSALFGIPAPGATPQSNGGPEDQLPIDNSGGSIEQRLQAAEHTLRTQRALAGNLTPLTREEIFKAASIDPTPRSESVVKDGVTWTGQSVFGSDGKRLTRTALVPTQQSPADTTRQQRAGVHADLSQAVDQTNAALAALKTYAALPESKRNGTTALAAASTEPTSVVKAWTREAGQSMLTPETQSALATLGALRNSLDSGQRNEEIKALAKQVSPDADLQDPAKVIKGLEALRDTLTSKRDAIAKGIPGAAAAPAAKANPINVHPSVVHNIESGRPVYQLDKDGVTRAYIISVVGGKVYRTPVGQGGK